MYLATYLAFNLDRLDEICEAVEKIAAAGEVFLEQNWTIAKTIVDEFDFNRIVYLGTASLKGVSQESALKMLELTAGKVATMFDTPLGLPPWPEVYYR